MRLFRKSRHHSSFILSPIQGAGGASLLLMLRDGVANDWASVCKECGLDPAEGSTAHSILQHKLEELRKAGFIEFDTDPRGYLADIIGPIRITKAWETAQLALGISLSELAELHPENTMVVRPHFGLPTKPLTTADLFILMPFEEELRPVYEDHIRSVTQRLKLTIARADDFFTAHNVMSDVWAAICEARIVVADCTRRNPNVFYEMGIAHVLGKSVILTTQDEDDVPFDVRHLRYIKYEYTPRGMIEFEKRFEETLKTVLKTE